MSQRIRLGISTCPNDTFAFHALMNRLVDWRGLEFQVELLDIQELNERLFRGEFDVAKASFHAALRLADRMLVLPSGSALGFGVGPLLLAALPETRPRSNSQVTPKSQVTLCPGELTTATLLFQLFYPNTTRIEQALFSAIMPALKERRADFGVCIHEGRFTWQSEGLSLVEDLGTRWESETHCPLPLGGILGKTNLGDELLQNVQAVIGDSLKYSLANPAAALPTMRLHAQEFDDRVLMQHVELYVNDWTVDLGPVGRDALYELSRRALSIGLVGSSMPMLQVLR
jgi:1,4-dihydroxy-6-naphthoate synthase